MELKKMTAATLCNMFNELTVIYKIFIAIQKLHSNHCQLDIINIYLEKSKNTIMQQNVQY